MVSSWASNSAASWVAGGQDRGGGRRHRYRRRTHAGNDRAHGFGNDVLGMATTRDVGDVHGERAYSVQVGDQLERGDDFA
ncbi:hypothetical protein [Nocardia salmonicida]|uniref:hypothetical protein n=1 Tax=Nocardia salmonicida TaxID=53431 RepID=UPI00371779CB